VVEEVEPGESFFALRAAIRALRAALLSRRDAVLEGGDFPGATVVATATGGAEVGRLLTPLAEQPSVE
jgi:hypothetical protein